MLRRAPSLAKQAALIFALIYGAILLAVLTINAAFSWADRGQGNMRGPRLAIDYAATELRWSGGRASLPPDGRFASLRARNPGLWLVVIRGERIITVGSAPPAARQSAATWRTVVGAAMLRLPGVDTRLGAMSVQRRETPEGPIVIAAGGIDPATLSARESIDQLLNPSLIIMLTVIGVLSLIGMWVAVPAFSRAMRPITSDARGISPREPGRRLDVTKAPKELLPLVNAFNTALDRLETELGRRRRFIADVAHELRTPLAVVSLRVEALPNDEDKTALRRGLSALTHLVVQMLDLERLSVSSERRSSIDLVAVTRDVVADLAPMALARGYDLALTAPDGPVVVTAETHGVVGAITNIVGNAIVHAGGSGQIMVTVREDRKIDVVDEGPGIAETLRDRMFEPFSRGSTDVEGSGLGLHIAREIMRSYGGDISAPPATRGATFCLSFPETVIVARAVA